MTTKHTSGPWYTRHNQISSLTSEHGCTIASCNATSKGISDIEVYANAARIVDCVNACEGINPDAVPDMLEALKAFVAYEEDQHGDEHATGECPGEDDCILCKGRAAISKAEGNG